MAQPAFNIFDVLSAWGKTLPGWQHFLLSKLVATVELTDETLDEVFAEYLIDQNLAGPDAVRVAWEIALPKFQESAPTVVASTLTEMAIGSGSRHIAGRTSTNADLPTGMPQPSNGQTWSCSPNWLFRNRIHGNPACVAAATFPCPSN